MTLINLLLSLMSFFREAFGIFDRNKDGYIDMNELRKMAYMVGAMLTNEEMDEFMTEADKE